MWEIIGIFAKELHKIPLMTGKRLSAIVFLITATLSAAAQTTENMTEDNQKVVPRYFYTGKEMEKVSDYIEQQYGEYDEVLDETVSPDIHCDIVIVPPTEKSPYYKLVTMGAGAYKMNIPLRRNRHATNGLNMSFSYPKTGMYIPIKKKTIGLCGF